MQVELLDRQKWDTRIELANAIFDYLEIWHNRKRRHSQLGWLSLVEFERNRIIASDIRIQEIRTTRNPGRAIDNRGEILGHFDIGTVEAINGRLKHRRGTALGFRNLGNNILRPLIHSG